MDRFMILPSSWDYIHVCDIISKCFHLNCLSEQSKKYFGGSLFRKRGKIYNIV